MSNDDKVEIDRESLEVLLELAKARIEDLPPNQWFYQNTGRWYGATETAEEALT